jgi:formylglycine-generating enzyme required for sulfatase activity
MTWNLFAVMFVCTILSGCGPPDRSGTIRDEASGIEMVLIPAGEFLMGTPDTEQGREEQEIPHRVRLTRPFYLGVTEVTQRQWAAVMGTNPSHFVDCGGDCPVERVSFHDIQAFLARLNSRSGREFRLPTEAEWEYACRAGGSEPFGHSATLGGRDAHINGRYPYRAEVLAERTGTTAVGRFPPNPWGLVDMSGNVWEWTQDPHCPYPASAVTDPVGRCESPVKVIRGGSWTFDGNSARCGLRYTHRPQDLGYSLGFRVARSFD